MSTFFNSCYKDLVPYTPGEQPQGRTYIKLNTNESPFPPSPAVIEAVNAKEAEMLRLYSDPTLGPLKKALAERYDVSPENVYVCNGSDEAINFGFMAWGEDGIRFADITYGFYNVIAALNHVRTEVIPLAEDFSIRKEDYLNAGCMVVIANPNAPTGKVISLAEIEEICASNKDHVVLIDEAYVDFGGETAILLTKKYPNLVVAQTFSKSRSLAGARVGYAIGSEALINDLETIKYSTNPYNVNRISMAAAVAAVKSRDYYRKNCDIIMENRAYTTEALRKLGFVVIDSKSNFVFAMHPEKDGGELYRELKENGILVRHFDSERICQYNRITIGTREQMETLIETVSRLI